MMIHVEFSVGKPAQRDSQRTRHTQLNGARESLLNNTTATLFKRTRRCPVLLAHLPPEEPPPLRQYHQ